MVRIVSGRFRGKRLKVPAGQHVRPTTDRIRESLFNILAHRFDDICRDARVLDLFAGSGSLGLEALSRGAAAAVLVEKAKSVVDLLRQNSASMGDAATVVHSDALHYLNGPVFPVNLVFLDPPYADQLIAPTLEALIDRTWLLPKALVCVEYASTNDLRIPEAFEHLDQRSFGGTTISFLQSL
ncbi:MAG: 16S rRNA (guanine(966)-N(2))-methyltransferase RsmD [Myxococcota bacterium]|nr:16S rRNA (guanine(966)-N(2))-methyltransferase RsmD [Myxococcota bacterium]